MAQNDTNKNGGNLGFEAEMFKAADKLRGNMEPSDYKHVALGLIFLKYISDAFEARHKALLADDPQAAEDKDEYLADNVFWVPKDARWSHLQANAKLRTPDICLRDAVKPVHLEDQGRCRRGHHQGWMRRSDRALDDLHPHLGDDVPAHPLRRLLAVHRPPVCRGRGKGRPVRPC